MIQAFFVAKKTPEVDGEGVWYTPGKELPGGRVEWESKVMESAAPNSRHLRERITAKRIMKNPATRAHVLEAFQFEMTVGDVNNGFDPNADRS